MARFILQKEFKSLILEKEKFKTLLDNLHRVVNEDNKNQEFKREINFKVGYKGGSSFESNNNIEFLDSLEEDKEIEILNINYFGYDLSIDFLIYKSLEPSINLKATDKGSLLALEDDINKILKNNGWNWILHSIAFSTLLIFLFSILIFLILYRFLGSIMSSKNIWYFIVGSYFGAFIAQSFMEKTYRKFILTIQNKPTSGRILQKDIYWILAAYSLGIISTIIKFFIKK